ncbi:hypothetical protein FRC01_013989, partial [Tulasnella sp. 417]
NNIEYFCQYVGGTYKSKGGHTAGFCKIPQYNLTLVNWFLFGMVDGDYDWFSVEKKPHNFEGRIQTFMLPMMREENLSNPDLIIERARHYNISHQDSPFTYTELVWHRSRIHALIHYTRELYGPKIPIMFRTRHFRFDNSWNHILRVFQLDQSVRAIAEELGIKLFTWGGKLEGHTNEWVPVSLLPKHEMGVANVPPRLQVLRWGPTWVAIAIRKIMKLTTLPPLQILKRGQ